MKEFGRVISSFRIVNNSKHYFYNSTNRDERQKTITDLDFSQKKNETGHVPTIVYEP